MTSFIPRKLSLEDRHRLNCLDCISSAREYILEPSSECCWIDSYVSFSRDYLFRQPQALEIPVLKDGEERLPGSDDLLSIVKLTDCRIHTGVQSVMAPREHFLTFEYGPVIPKKRRRYHDVSIEQIRDILAGANTKFYLEIIWVGI